MGQTGYRKWACGKKGPVTRPLHHNGHNITFVQSEVVAAKCFSAKPDVKTSLHMFGGDEGLRSIIRMRNVFYVLL